MSKAKFSRLLLLLWITQWTAGCGYIKSLFPDKERDYQFRTEIPELMVPEDLKNKGLPLPPRTTPEQMAQAAVAAVDAEGRQENRPQASPAENSSVTMGSIVSSNPTVSSLQIDQARNQAWRLVAKALSRQQLEIVERNLDKGYFYVNYDPHATKPEDGSLWDEVTFLFGDDPSHEKEYRISLQEIAPQVTEVTIQDQAGKTLSDAPAVALLKLITDGINQELPGTKSSQPAAGESAP